MRYIIYGAGAIGGTIGARLQMAGCEVVYIARGAHLAAMREDGLFFRTPDGDHRLTVTTAGSADGVAWREGDVALLTVKSQDTIDALEDIRAAAGTDVPVICGQNGVANEHLALRLFENVYAMVIMLPATHTEPGVVRAESAPTTGVLDTGRFPGGTDAVCEQVSADLERSTFSARPDPKVMRLKYRKLLMNLDNAIGAICRPGDDSRELSRLARVEAEAVYRSGGVDAASDREFYDRRADYIKTRTIEGAPRGGSSSWQSLARGTGSIEVDFLNGEIVYLGRLHGVPTPVNRLLQEEAIRFAREGTEPCSLDASEVLSRLAGYA